MFCFVLTYQNCHICKICRNRHCVSSAGLVSEEFKISYLYLHISLQHHWNRYSCWKHATLEHCCRLVVCSHYQYTVHHPALSVHLPGQSRHWAVPHQLENKIWYLSPMSQDYRLIVLEVSMVKNLYLLRQAWVTGANLSVTNMGVE